MHDRASRELRQAATVFRPEGVAALHLRVERLIWFGRRVDSVLVTY
jgi:hypothetical protein